MKMILSEKGTILIISSLVLAILLVLGSYFLTSVITESKISRSQAIAAQTYYLAEAGVNEAIWRLKNDSEWLENFETEPFCGDWSSDFSKSDILLPGSSYQIQIQNSECARGQIIATSTIEVAEGKTAQRVVKVKIFKALGSLTEDSPLFTGGTSENIDVSASVINLYDGNFFGNNNINIKYSSQVNIFDNQETEKEEGKVFAGNNVNLDWGSELNATAICSKNICQGDCSEEGCPMPSLSMPMIDFDSTDYNSYKSQASANQNGGLCSVLCNGVQCSTQCVFTADEFEDLLWQIGLGGTLTLNNKITYVTGIVNLKGGRKLEINGILVADRTVDIGKKDCWTKLGDKYCGFNQLTINDPGPGIPSGLLTKAKINFGLYSSLQNIEITGLIYANDEISLISLPQTFNLTGGLLGRKISIISGWQVINLYLDNTVIFEGVWGGPEPPEGEKPPYSPIVTIEHWEETY